MSPPSFILPANHGSFLRTTRRSSAQKKPFHLTTARIPLRMSAGVDRRDFIRLAATCTAAALASPVCATETTQGVYSTYKGPLSLGYSFDYPSSWVVKKKPIRTHLSEVNVTSDRESSTSVGVVVDNVKIDSIEDFGTPETVGRKVVDVETKKENVNNAFVSSAESVSKGGLTYYIIDYTVDSSRGVKRYVAKVTVNAKQLYVLTAQAKEKSFDEQTKSTFSKMLESFNVVKQYL